MSTNTEHDSKGREDKMVSASVPPTANYFQALPLELRNEVYDLIFPLNIEFDASQSMAELAHGRTNMTALVPRNNPVAVDGVKISYLLGILGTCQKIRQEARSKKHSESQP